MKIRKEQMDSFEQAELTKFAIRIVDFLQTEFPEAKEIPVKELMTVVYEQVTRARTYGLETEQQIANYVTTAWLLGQEFDTEFPAAKEMLESEHTPNEKSEWLALWTKEMFSTLEGSE